MANRKWPEKNPETSNFPAMTTPLSTDAPGPDARPGINRTVPDNPDPSNPVGYTGMERNTKKGRGRK